MSLKLYNTLTGVKEVFTAENKNVKMYSCGPTVYAPPHIGNYRSFTVADVLKRFLEYTGYNVKHVMNITDIDDKTIRESRRLGFSLKEFTDKYIQVFFQGLKTLNIKPADIYPRATENIEDMLRLTKHLLEKGYAYVKAGSVYYDISKFRDYGKLSKINLENIKEYSTVDSDEYGKDDPRDFALLKAASREEIEHGVYYYSEWGPVRPGWHIECSVMSMKYLGERIDIHTGGVDLIFPHHENEIAQSEAYTGGRVVRYWVHSEHLTVNGRKMSKSEGNYYTLEDLLKEYEPGALRYFLISAHYKRKLDLTSDTIRNAVNNYSKLKETYQRAVHFSKSLTEKSLQTINRKLIEFQNSFKTAMNDDLNTPLALQVLHKLAKYINNRVSERNLQLVEAVLNIFIELSNVLGLKFSDKTPILPAKIRELIFKREQARLVKNWAEADQIRELLKSEGVILVDTPSGVRVILE